MQAMPRIMYDKSGNVQAAQKLKGVACALWTDLVHEISRGGVKAGKITKKRSDGVEIEFRYHTDAYEQVNGTAKIFVPGGQIIEQDCGGFLGAPSNVYFFPTTTKDFKTIVPNTTLKGTNNYWHGTKETVCWDSNNVYIRAVKYQLFTSADVVKYAFVIRADGYLVVFIRFDANKKIGVKIYLLAGLDAMLVSQTEVFSATDYFDGLTTMSPFTFTEVEPLQILVNRTATKMVIMGRNNGTPTNALPASVPVLGSYTYGNGIEGFYDPMLQANDGNMSAVDKKPWNTIFEFDISEINAVSALDSTWITSTAITNQYLMHVYKFTKKVNTATTYSENFDTPYNITTTLCGVNISPDTEQISPYQISSSASTTTNYTYTALYNAPIKTVVYLNGNVFAYEYITTDVKVNNLATSNVKTHIGSGSDVGYAYDTLGGSSFGIGDVVVTHAHTLNEKLTFTAVLHHGSFTIPETFESLRNSTYSSSSAWGVTLVCTLGVPSTSGFASTTYQQNTTNAKYDVRKMYQVTGFNPYIDDISAQMDVKREATDILNLAGLPPLVHLPITPTTQYDYFKKSWEQGRDVFILADTSETLLNTYYPYNYAWGQGRYATANDIHLMYANFNVTNTSTQTQVAGSTSSSEVINDYYFCFSHSTDSRYENNSIVRNEADKCGNMLYALSNALVSPTQTGVKALKKDFSLSSKQTEIDAILEIPNDMIGVV
jgi:hypothetical protein